MSYALDDALYCASVCACAHPCPRRTGWRKHERIIIIGGGIEAFPRPPDWRRMPKWNFWRAKAALPITPRAGRRPCSCSNYGNARSSSPDAASAVSPPFTLMAECCLHASMMIGGGAGSCRCPSAPIARSGAGRGDAGRGVPPLGRPETVTLWTMRLYREDAQDLGHRSC